MTKKLILCALVAALAACNSKDQDARHPEPMTSPTNPPGSSTMPTSMGNTGSGSSMTRPAGTTTPAAATVDMPSNTGSTTSAPDISKPSASYSDAEIAAIMDAANGGEVEEGKVAQKSAKDAAVKNFARMMVDHHTEARDKQSKLMSKMSVAPSDNTKSRELKAEGQSNLDKLKPLKGADFDRAYIDNQVKEHQTVLSLLDSQLLPSVKNAEYKALLQEVRGRVEQHLKTAEDLQKKMSAKTSGG